MSDQLSGEGEDAALTFLFTDIEGSSALWEQDPAAMRVALELHDDLVRRVADDSGGSIFSAGGDGFGLAYETATGAVVGARTLQIELATAAWPETARLNVRIGLHSGPAERRDHNYFGTTVNRANRVMDAANGGQVLVSGETASKVPASAGLVELGLYQLRGLREPERLWWMPIAGVEDAPLPELRVRRAGDVAQPALPTRLRIDTDDFVGRDRPLAQIMQAWQVARDGGSPVIVVGGDAGVGKTRLVAEVARRVHAEGGAVLYGRCDPHGAAPLQPFVEALSGFADGVDDGTAKIVIDPTNEPLAHLLARSGASDVAPDPASNDDANPLATFHAIADALTVLGEASPGVLLVLDDLHWSDASTLALLEHLAVSMARPAVAIVALYRPTDVTRDGVIEGILGTLRRRSGSTVVHLGGLTLAEVEEIVASAAGHDLGDLSSVVSDLYATTEGNAFFVHELIRHLVASNAATFDGSRWKVRPVSSVGIPRGVRELVHERLHLLPGKTTSLLADAAVFGQEFDVRHLAAATDVDVEQVLVALEPALTNGLLRESVDGRISFGHLLVQRSIYEDRPRAERIDAHVRAARAIEATPGAQRHHSELAHHWGVAAFAGHAEEAVRAAARAGDDAIASAVYESAIDFYKRALSLAQDLIAGVTTSLDVRLKLASALTMAGRLDEAAVEFASAADEARFAARPDLLARAALGIGGDLPSTPPADPGAIALVEEALAAHPDPSPTRARLLCRLAERRHRIDTASTRGAWTDEAVRISEALGDDALRASVLLSRVRSLHGPETMEEMLTISAEVDRIAMNPPDDALAVRSAQVRMNSSFALGDLPGAVNAARITSVLAQRLRQPEYDRLPLMWEAFRATYQGRFDDARAIVSDLQAVLALGRHSQTASMVGALVMPEMIFRGNTEAAYMVTLDLDVPYRDALLAWFSSESGALERATDHLRRLVPVEQIQAESNWSWWQAMAGTTTAAALCGERWLLSDVRRAMEPWADQHATAGLVTYLGSGHLHVGVAARELGDLDVAVEHLDEAVVAHESIGAVPFVAWSQIELAKALAMRRRSGDVARAAELKATSLATATTLGLESVLRRG